MLSLLRTLAVVTAVLLTLTHVANGQNLGECVKDVQLFEQCVFIDFHCCYVACISTVFLVYVACVS